MKTKLRPRAPPDHFVTGRQWTLCAVDEAHAGRKDNHAFGAYYVMNEQSEFMVAMTATPVQQSPRVCLILFLSFIHLY